MLSLITLITIIKSTQSALIIIISDCRLPYYKDRFDKLTIKKPESWLCPPKVVAGKIGSTPFDWFDKLTTGKLRAGKLTTDPSTALRASWV